MRRPLFRRDIYLKNCFRLDILQNIICLSRYFLRLRKINFKQIPFIIFLQKIYK